jgi:Recombinase/Recombinase zinc beta ribbon domain
MTVHAILTNPVYLGDFSWGQRARGKFVRFAGKGKNPHTVQGKAKREDNPEQQWVFLPDNHAALVERDRFAEVQARLVRRRLRTTPYVGGGNFLLSKLLVCGHCHAFMVGMKNRGEAVYICSTYHCSGGRQCHRNTMHEAQALDAIAGKLQTTVLSPAYIQRLRAELLRKAEEAHASIDPTRANAMLAQIADLDRKIDQGNENLAILPRDRIPGVAAKLREWEAARDQLKRYLALAENGAGAAAMQSIEEEVALAEAQLWRLREALGQGDPPIVRAALQDLVSKVELHFDHRQVVKRETTRFREGLIHLRTADDHVQLVKDGGSSLLMYSIGEALR